MKFCKKIKSFLHIKKDAKIKELQKALEDYLHEKNATFSAEEVQQYDYLINIKDAMGLCAEIAFAKDESVYSKELQALYCIHSRIIKAPGFDADRFWRFIAQAQL